jgi:KUP system potassium uptake protein
LTLTYYKLHHVPITFSADNHGEGYFALYALVKKTKIKWLIVPAIIEESALLADGIINLLPYHLQSEDNRTYYPQITQYL